MSCQTQVTYFAFRMLSKGHSHRERDGIEVELLLIGHTVLKRKANDRLTHVYIEQQLKTAQTERRKARSC